MPSRPSPGSYPGPVQVPSRVRGGPVQIRHVLCFTVFRTHPGPEVRAIPPVLVPSCSRAFLTGSGLDGQKQTSWPLPIENFLTFLSRDIFKGNSWLFQWSGPIQTPTQNGAPAGSVSSTKGVVLRSQKKQDFGGRKLPVEGWGGQEEERQEDTQKKVVAWKGFIRKIFMFLGSWPFWLDIFEPLWPWVTPQQEISKTLNSSKIP